MTQFLFDVGSEHPTAFADKLLSHLKTASSKFSGTVTAAPYNVSKESKEVFSGTNRAVTLGSCSHACRRINLIVLQHVTLLRKAWKIGSYARDNCRVTRKVTEENSEINIMTTLRSFGLLGIFDKLVFVTNGGEWGMSNIVAVLNLLSQFTHFSCSAHILNTVLEHSTQEQDGDLEGLILSCRDLIIVLKRSGQQHRLNSGERECKYSTE
jgi:hypothetical protein